MRSGLSAGNSVSGPAPALGASGKRRLGAVDSDSDDEVRSLWSQACSSCVHAGLAPSARVLCSFSFSILATLQHSGVRVRFGQVAEDEAKDEAEAADEAVNID